MSVLEIYKRAMDGEQPQRKIQFSPRTSCKSNYTTMVNQYSLDGTFIASYASLTEAEKATGVSVSNISKCINGVTTRAGKYTWEKS